MEFTLGSIVYDGPVALTVIGRGTVYRDDAPVLQVKAQVAGGSRRFVTYTGSECYALAAEADYTGLAPVTDEAEIEEILNLMGL